MFKDKFTRDFHTTTVCCCLLCLSVTLLTIVQPQRMKRQQSFEISLGTCPTICFLFESSGITGMAYLSMKFALSCFVVNVLSNLWQNLRRQNLQNIFTSHSMISRVTSNPVTLRRLGMEKLLNRSACTSGCAVLA